MPPIPRPSTPLPNAFRGASASISEKTSFHTGDTGSPEHAPSSSAGRLMMGKNHGVCHVSAANLPQGYNALPSSSTSLANGVKRLRDLMLRFMCVLLRDVRRHLIPLTEVQDQEPDMSLSAIFNLERYLHHSEMQSGGDEMRSFPSLLAKKRRTLHTLFRGCLFHMRLHLKTAVCLLFSHQPPILYSFKHTQCRKPRPLDGARIIKKAATEMRRRASG